MAVIIKITVPVSRFLMALPIGFTARTRRQASAKSCFLAL